MEDLLNLVALKDQNALITLEEVHYFIRDADEVYDSEARRFEETSKKQKIMMIRKSFLQRSD